MGKMHFHFPLKWEHSLGDKFQIVNLNITWRVGGWVTSSAFKEGIRYYMKKIVKLSILCNFSTLHTVCIALLYTLDDSLGWVFKSDFTYPFVYRCIHLTLLKYSQN